MALEDTTGGLPADEPQIKATMPKTGGLSLAGQKGVSLNPSDSSEIRDRLMQMIAQREQASSGWGPIMERAAVSAGAPGTFAQNLQSFNTNQRNKEKELFDMRVGLAQLNTEEARIKQAQELAAQQKQQFMTTLGLANPPQAGGVPQAGAVPQTGDATQAGDGLNAQQKATLLQMYQTNPQEAQKQYLALTKPTDLQRELSFLPPPVRNQIIAAAKAGDMYKPFTYYDSNLGREVQKSAADIFGSMLGVPSQTSGAPAPVGAPVPAPAPVGAPVASPAPVSAPVAGPSPAPAPAPAPVAAPAPAPVAAKPPATTGLSPEALSIQNMPNPHPKASPAYAQFENERAKKVLEQQSKEAGVAVAGQTREAEELAKINVKQQEQHSADVKEAQANAMIAQNMQQDIRTAGSLLGKLAGGGAQSAFFGLIDGGIQVGNMGSVNLPKFTEAVVKMDPNAKKPEVMDAYTRVAKDVERMKLAYTRVAFENQGAVSNNERDLIRTAVGDVDRMSPANLMRMAKATELEARNRMDQDRLWGQMRDAGMSWSQYKNSPEFKELQRKQYYRTAKAFGVENAKYPGDQ